MSELHAGQIKILESLPGVVVRDLSLYSEITFSATVDDGRIYQVKAAALLFSRFEKVLFLDSDNYALKDPGFLFESPPFKETGALFWKDFWKTRPDNPIWSFLNLKCVDEYEQESGQIAVDKSKPGVVKALSLTLYLLGQSELYFKLMLGDKDYFRLSWRILSQPYHSVRPHLAVIGFNNEDGFCGIAMAQYAPFWDAKSFGPSPPGYVEEDTPDLLFVHTNMLKWFKRINFTVEAVLIIAFYNIEKILTAVNREWVRNPFTGRVYIPAAIPASDHRNCF